MDDATAALAEIDDKRRRTFDAYAARDLDTYLDMYAPGARYTNAAGRTTDREQLARDTRIEWTMVRDPQATWQRESWSMDGDLLREIVRSELSATVYGRLFFKRTDSVQRRTEYAWRRDAGGWRVVEARVLDEKRTSSPLRLGFHRAGCVTFLILAALVYAIALLF